MSQIMTGKYYLGRKIVDYYGRTLGKVVGYYTKTKGSPPLLGVELVEGDFSIIPTASLIDETNVLVLDESWKTKAESLTQNLTLIRRKISALDKLYKSGEISNDSYESLGKDFEAESQDLHTRFEDLRDKLEVRSKTLAVKSKDVESYFVNVKLAHELGEIDDEAYRISRDALHDLINRLQTEQKDVKVAQECLQPLSAPIKQPQIEPEKPPAEIPIVLKIEEAEK